MARNCNKMKEILEELDMREKIEAFEKEKIDLQCFLSLTENQLQRLGVTTLGDIHRLTSRVRMEMKKEEETPGSSSETIKDERHTGTQSQHSHLLQQISNNRNVLFGRGKRGKKTKKSHGMPNFEEDLPSNKKTKRSFRSWTATVVCLPNKDTCRIPSTEEKETNFKAGLGAKRIKFITSDNEEQVLNTIMSDEVVDNETIGFPALKNCGGFELLKCYQNCRELKNIECAWTVANLKTFLGCQSKLYVRPIQRNLSTEPITTASDPNSQVRCEICQKSVSVRELRSHLKTCDLDSNDKSDNDELYNPMLTKTDDVVQHVEENVEVDSMDVNDVCRDRPSGMFSQLSEVHLVDIQRTNIRKESQEIPGSSNYIEVNIEEQTNQNQSGSSIVEECISIEHDNQNADSPPTLNNAVDITLGSQIAASCKEDNSVVDLDCTIEKIIESCLEKKIVDPVEILRFAQDKLLTGRQLDIQEDNMVTELEGDTNFILVDRNNILQTSFEEISEIKSGDIRKTLQVEFYGETAADFGGPRREFFRLVLTEIKTKYFEKGIREYLAADYVIVGKIMVQHKTYKEYENQDSIAIPRTTAWRLQKRKHDEMEDMSTSNMSNKSICQGTPCSNTAADDSIQEQSSYTAADESIQEQSSYTAADESIQEQSSYTAADESIQEQSSYTAADESIQEQSSYTATDRSHYSGSEITNTVSYPRVEPIQQNDLANDINNSEFDTDLNELGSDMDIENSDSSNSEDEIKNSELDIFDDDGGDYDDYNDNDKTILNNTLSSTPLYVIPSQNNHFESPITYEDHILTVNAYASRHHLSDSAYTDLLNLLQLHLPDNSLLDTNINKMKEQCGFNLDHLNFHTFCTICENVFQNKNEQCQTPGCNGRRKSSRNSNYFVTGNIDKQLKDVLTKSGMWQSIQERANSTPSADVITDIVDGSEYKKLKQEGQFLNNSNNISVSFFTDGIPLFKSSGVSLWPVYLLINEIPRKERFLKKNMLLWGIWQGSGKPNMTIFLKSLVSDLQKLYNEGIVFHIEGKPICSKVILLVGTMDLPARAGVLNMTQYNGEYACIFCLHPGVVVKSGKGHCRSFPYREEPKRTTTETRLHAEEAHNTRKRVKGMLGISVLNFLPYYSLCEYIVVDYMHGILLGICKKLLGMWFNATSADKPYFIGTKIKEVDKLLKNIKPPYLINRLPRKLSNTLHHWKASELRSWLLFYAIPCLRDFLPDLYLKHFSTLVEATYILLGEGISTQDLDRADLLIITFVKSAECLYGKQFMGLNVHNLLHLVDCVKKWGPLWAWSCFCFESFNGEIKQGIHGTGNVCRGIFWSIHAEKFIHSMIASDDNTCTRKSNTKEFLKHLNSGHLMAESKTTAANQCQVLHAKEISENFPYFKDICDQLEIITGDKSRKDFLKAPKIIRNGYVMYSKLCTKVKKRNSFCVRSMEGNTCKYMEVEYYLLHPASGRVFAVGSNLTVIGNVLDNRVPHIKEIKLDRNGYIVKKVELLMDVMVTTTVQRKTYISAMPNTIERN